MRRDQRVRVMRRGKRQSGFVLMYTAISAIVLVGMLGVAADLGRAYVVRNELMAFADAAAVAAAYELDGTRTGLTAARAMGESGPGTNGWNFGTTAVSGAQVRFASTSTGAYETAAAAPDGARFVRVTATRTLPLFFLPILPGIAHSLPISATAVAGQGVVASPGEGSDPFSPDAIDPGDKENFGFKINEQYDIKWAPPGFRKKARGKCEGDIAADQDAAGGAADRGYIDVGQGGGNSHIYDAIVNNDYGYDPMVPGTGEPIITLTGNEHVGPALTDRINQDSDHASVDYSTYTGNGRRLLLVPVNDHTPTGLVLGYAAFFLPLDSYCLDNNNFACCAQYLGPAVLGGKKKAAGPAGNLYAVRLFQ